MQISSNVPGQKKVGLTLVESGKLYIDEDGDFAVFPNGHSEPAIILDVGGTLFNHKYRRTMTFAEAQAGTTITLTA